MATHVAGSLSIPWDRPNGTGFRPVGLAWTCQRNSVGFPGPLDCAGSEFQSDSQCNRNSSNMRAQGHKSCMRVGHCARGMQICCKCPIKQGQSCVYPVSGEVLCGSSVGEVWARVRRGVRRGVTHVLDVLGRRLERTLPPRYRRPTVYRPATVVAGTNSAGADQSRDNREQPETSRPTVYGPATQTLTRFFRPIHARGDVAGEASARRGRNGRGRGRASGPQQSTATFKDELQTLYAGALGCVVRRLLPRRGQEGHATPQGRTEPHQGGGR
eukprot:366264-Chlamydomonas_euryale.AAC.5